jgi:hypothetical protein
LVIRSVIGNVKTAVFVALVVVMATVAGIGFGALNLSEIAPTTVANTAASQIP